MAASRLYTLTTWDYHADSVIIDFLADYVLHLFHVLWQWNNNAHMLRLNAETAADVLYSACYYLFSYLKSSVYALSLIHI